MWRVEVFRIFCFSRDNSGIIRVYHMFGILLFHIVVYYYNSTGFLTEKIQIGINSVTANYGNNMKSEEHFVKW